MGTEDQGLKIKDQRSKIERARPLIFNPSIFGAYSISQTLTPTLSPSPPPTLSLRVLSLHRRVCNLLSEQGDVMALVHPDIGNGPFHIVLAQPASFATLEVGEPGTWSGDSITFGRFAVDLTEATPWDPALPQSPASLLSDRMPRRGGSRSAPHTPEGKGRSRSAPAPDLNTAITQRLQQGAKLLLSGLHHARIDDIESGAERLAGLGTGLTPAGDDFLLGFMARIWLEPALLPTAWTAPDLCQRIVQIAGARTTLLSRTWLTHAARRRFAEPWHDLAAALAIDDQPAIQHAAARILSTGATSGRDAMAGFLLVAIGY